MTILIQTAHQEMRPLMNYEVTTPSNVSRQDCEAIEKGRILDDTVINKVQSILKEEIPNAAGLQDTVLEEKLHFKALPHVPYVHIVHDESLHWAAIST